MWAPDPVVLAELSRIYRTDLRALIAVLKANRQNPALTGDEADATLKGAIDAESSATGLLEQLEEASGAAMREVHDIAARLIDIAAEFPVEDTATERDQAARSKGRARRR